MYIVRYEKARRRNPRELFQATCPVYVASQEAGMILLEMQGPEQAVRAIAFSITESTKKRNVMIRDDIKIIEGSHERSLRIDPQQRFKMITKPVRDKDGVTGIVNFMLMHPDFSQYGNGRFMLGGTEEEPSPWFASCFTRRVAIPFLHEWVWILWDEGIKKDLITQRGPVWELSSSTYHWNQIVRRLIREGELV